MYTLDEHIAARFFNDRVYLIGDELLEYLKKTYGRKVVLAFSASKDSLVAWLALRDAGFEVFPYYMALVPGLEFIERNLRYYENYFNTHIVRLPHPHFYINLKRFNYQTPERVAIIRAIPDMKYGAADIDAYLMDKHNAGWAAYGTRWSDNSTVRQSIKKHGIIFDANRVAAYIVWNMTNDQIANRIIQEGVKISDEYHLFRSPIRGFQYNFLKGIKKHFPDDYNKILKWYPLIDLELYRFDVVSKYGKEKS